MGRMGKCHNCGKEVPWRELQTHHVKFKSRGGKDNKSNLKLLCTACHKDAHGLIPKPKPGAKPPIDLASKMAGKGDGRGCDFEYFSRMSKKRA